MNKSPARSRADIQFASQTRDTQIKDEITRERARTDAKTAKLKALRLARDEELRIEQARLDAINPPKPAKARRGAGVKKSPATGA
jgi:hypothetical protein